MTYSVEELVNELIEEYSLDVSTEVAKKNYKAQVYRILKEEKIWENAIKENGVKKISEQQKKHLVLTKKMYNYITHNSTSNEIKNRKPYNEVQKEILKRRNEYIEQLEALSNDSTNDDTPCISHDNLQKAKYSIMLTALFEHFFTPINESLLLSDLEQVLLLKNELHLEMEDMEAERRLAHPNGNYFYEKPKEDIKDKQNI